MKKNNLFTNLRWISFVSRRFARVDRKGRSAVTSALATLGICFGVMTLTVVMSVMNGFQMSFIDSILEVSSYHLRALEVPESEEEALIAACKADKYVRSEFANDDNSCVDTSVPKAAKTAKKPAPKSAAKTTDKKPAAKKTTTKKAATTKKSAKK